MDATPTPRSRARRLVRALARLHPDARCSLDHGSPLQLLVATILSAQCTDARVNSLTSTLFARYPTARAFAEADPDELADLIRSVTYPHNKAKHLIACGRQLLDLHGGEVPANMADLVSLAGVGRKTANVVLGNAFGIPGLPVDTHVGRLSQRLGLTTNTDPVLIEADLTALLPRAQWVRFGHRMIHHGRVVCHARKPRCGECGLADLCPRVGLEPLPEGTTDEHPPRSLLSLRPDRHPGQ